MSSSSTRDGKLVDRTAFECLKRTYLLLRIDSHHALDAAPGQFIMLETGEDCFLDRPFSILDAMGSIMELLIEIRGKGTNNLLLKEVGDTVRFKGPYGKGLNEILNLPGKKVDLIAGGVGIVPLYFFCWECLRRGRYDDISLLFGAGEREFFDALKIHLNFPNIFRGMDVHLIPFNEMRMTVVDFYKKYLEGRGYEPNHVISCGPEEMQEAVQDIILEMDVTGHLLLERRMACGRGMCMGCPVRIVENGEEILNNTCTDGPAFEVGRDRKVVFK